MGNVEIYAACYEVISGVCARVPLTSYLLAQGSTGRDGTLWCYILVLSVIVGGLYRFPTVFSVKQGQILLVICKPYFHDWLVVCIYVDRRLTEYHKPISRWPRPTTPKLLYVLCPMFTGAAESRPSPFNLQRRPTWACRFVCIRIRNIPEVHGSRGGSLCGAAGPAGDNHIIPYPHPIPHRAHPEYLVVSGFRC